MARRVKLGGTGGAIVDATNETLNSTFLAVEAVKRDILIIIIER